MHESPIAEAEKQRDRRAEAEIARSHRNGRMAEMIAARREGTLGEEHIRLAQAMILCTLPYSEPPESRISRRARLGDGTYLQVTFSAAIEGVALPWGADRKLLAWIFDRALRAQSPRIPWSSANEYLREMGMSLGGRNNRLLADRFARIKGLVINVRRRGALVEDNQTYPVIARSRLPSSVTGRLIEAGQQALPELDDGFGFVLNSDLWEDIRRYRVVLPRQIWHDLRGPAPVQDIVFWLLYRCYSAKTESLIPWGSLGEQFSSDSNPWRLKSYAREAIRLIRNLWPEARIEAQPSGIWIDYAARGLMQDDPEKGRERSL